MDYSTITDEMLVTLSRAGDTFADETLIERYKNIVRLKARPYFLIGADREDLLQEGMIGLYKAIRDYEPGHNAVFRSFAEICIVRQLISAVKSSTRKKHTPLNSYISLYRNVYEDEKEQRPLLDTIPSSHIEGPEDVFIAKEGYISIVSSIESKLTLLEKDVLELFLAGHSYQDISQIIGRGHKTVDNALQRVKKKLEKHLVE